MKNILRYSLILLVLGFGVAAHAQMTFTLGDMYKVNTTQWKYGTVTCSSPDNITSIIISMINNEIASNTSGITPANQFNSLENNPKTVLYLFSPPIPASDVVSFIKGMTFTQNNNIVVGANPSVDITVDANKTIIPDGAKITAWNDHPDGTPHYYVWVEKKSIYYETAYNQAKQYCLQGMRGYLPTITSAGENQTLKNISSQQGWSGGVRTRDAIADGRQISQPSATTGVGTNYYMDDGVRHYYDGSIFRWICGPETNFEYYRGPKYSATGVMNNAFTDWNPNTPEPNNSTNENCMQVNFTLQTWNDYAPHQSAIEGYFIEFGGNGERDYTVNGALYKANPKYRVPEEYTDNDQWYEFTPGKRVSTKTTFKPNVMRSNVLIIE